MKKIVASLLIFSIFMPAVSFAQLPQDAQEAGEVLEEVLETSEKELPQKIKDMWQNDVLPVWSKMFSWFNAHIWPIFTKWFNREVKPEIEKRTPDLEEELEKEKEEIKEELPRVGKSLWDKFKEILQQ